MRKITTFFIGLLFICLITGCQEGKKVEITETEETTIFIQDDHSNVLVRPWLFSEVCKSVYFDGVNVGFPFMIATLNKAFEMDNDYILTTDYFSETFASGVVITPNSSAFYVTFTSTSETPLDADNLTNTPISSIKVLYLDGVTDFSLYQISFGYSVSKIYSDFGIPDYVNEYEQDGVSFMELYYQGLDSQSVVFKLVNNKLSEMFLSR